MKCFYGFAFLLVTAIASVFHCSRTALLAGNSSSETTNGCMAVVYRSDGTPAVGAQVRLRRSDYVSQPVTSLTKSAIYAEDALIDAQGRFQIYGIDKGTYSIEVSDPSDGPGQGGAVLLSCTVDMHDTVNFGTDTLRPYASVRGALDTTGISGKSIYVQILGLERLISIGPPGGFTLNELPAGLFSLRIITVAGSQITVIRTDQVAATSGDTVAITMPGWGFAKRLFFNTTASGADVAGDVAEFPALVRLTRGNFNFAGARSGGEDVRFTKSDGTALSFEIERWDASQNLAEIWVKVDTIFGNDSTHYIIMFWGLRSTGSATSLSNSAAVFDTAVSGGFQGVWHLNQPAGSVEKDATYNHFDGTPSDTAPVVTEGQIGAAKEFNGTSSFLDMKNTASGKLNFPENGQYTISAWVYAEALDNSNHCIVGKGNDQYFLKQKYSQLPQPYTWEFVEYHDASGWQITDYASSARTWVYLVGVRNNKNQSLYINGELVNDMPSNNPQTLFRDTTQDVTIGRYLKYVSVPNEGFCPFHGIIDEVRISNVSRSADWEKLCFMNQKEPDALVMFK